MNFLTKIPEQPLIGTVLLWVAEQVPEGWMICDGTLLSIEGHEQLFDSIGNKYGGDGVRCFALPDMRDKLRIGAHGIDLLEDLHMKFIIAAGIAQAS